MIVCAFLSAFVSSPLYFVQPMSSSTSKITAANLSACLTLANDSTYYGSQYGNTSCNNCSNCFVSIDDLDIYGPTFFIVLLISVLFVLTTIPLASLIDATTMYVLGKDKFHLYGMQRLWGAVGFGVVGLLVGILIDVYSRAINVSNQRKDYLLAFICLFLFEIITGIVIFSLDVPKHKVSFFFSTFCSVVKDKQIVLLLFVVFISGFNLATRYAFTFWYIMQLPGANPTLLGLSVLVGCLCEVPTFFVSGWAISKLGCQLILALGLLASAVSLLWCFAHSSIPCS